MKVRIPNASIIRKAGVPTKIGFSVSWDFVPALEALLESAHKKGIAQLSVEMELPFRPKSTGKHSQNSHIHGHCRDIADQLVDPETGEQIYTPEEIKQAMKRMAVGDRGYPSHLSIDGREEPMSLRYASVEQANMVIDTIHQYSDENNLWLTEYDEETGEVYRSVGGRRREEMERVS